MIGAYPIGESAVGDNQITEPNNPPDTSIDALSVPFRQTVVFEGGRQVIEFEGSRRIVEFE